MTAYEIIMVFLGILALLSFLRRLHHCVAYLSTIREISENKNAYPVGKAGLGGVRKNI